MKLKYSILLSVAALLAVSSCRDFLNPEPSGFDASYVFADAKEAKKVLLGAYALFNTDDYTSRMANIWMENTDVEAVGVGATEGGDRRSVWALEADRLRGFSEMDQRWENCYQAIDRCNQTIEGIEASPAKNDRDMKMLYGEAHCLRAYRYFLLCNFWGDVPYYREASKVGMDLDRDKTDKNIIYSGMIQDLVDYEGDMYYMNEFPDGVERMNREFALGMIARLALFRAGYGMTKEGTMQRADDYMGGDAPSVTYTINGQTKTATTSNDYYELAKAYCQKLMSERPKELGNFAKVFRDQCELIINHNGEVLYEVAHGSSATGSRGDVGWVVGVPVYGGSKGSTTIQVNFAPTYYFTFDPKDTRRDVTCSLIAYNDDTEQRILAPTGVTSGKWNRLWLPGDPGSGSSKATGANWPVMRYTDVLLMLAEAENELNGPTAEAKNALKEVRNRAFKADDRAEKVNTYVDALSSKEDFFKAIVDERAWEFGGECVRKFDLVRWNIYGEKIVETIHMMHNMGKAARGIDTDKPAVAKYLNVADYVYYERINGTIRFLNTPDAKHLTLSEDDAMTENDKDGYVSGEGEYAKRSWAREFWGRSVTDKGVTTYHSEPTAYAANSWRGYCWYGAASAYQDKPDAELIIKDNARGVPYLLPIGNQTVSTSRVLNNNGYGHPF